MKKQHNYIKEVTELNNNHLLNDKEIKNIPSINLIDSMKVLKTDNEKDSQVVISSRTVAEVFEKKHKNVMRDIRDLIEKIECPEMSIPLEASNMLFCEAEYTHPQNKQKYTEYLVNKDGFTLLAMGFTGKKALRFKLEFIKAFNRKEEELRQLKKDVISLHGIAKSDEDQKQREEEANRTLYAFRNIKMVIESSSYNTLEENVNKILNHHENLHKKYKYKSHQEMTNTEYKQHVRRHVIEKIEEVSLNKRDMLFHNVSDQIVKDLKGEIISTINRSTGAKLSKVKNDVKLLKEELNDPKDKYPIEDLIKVNIHPFSVNKMYTYNYNAGRLTKTREYRNWINNFPKKEVFLSLKEECIEKKLVDYNKPLKFIMRVDAKERMDIDNMSKTFVDVVTNDVLNIDDNLIDSIDIKRNKNVKTYEEGKIYFTIRNI